MQQDQDTSQVRRGNLIALFHEYASSKVQTKGATTGLQQEFAQALKIHPSLWSLLKSGKRQVGDKLARQIERLMDKPIGWLDLVHGANPSPSDAEQAFLDLALRAYRATNARGRAALRKTLEQICAG